MGEVTIDWPSAREPATVYCPKLKECILVTTCWAVIDRGGDVGTTFLCEFFDHMAIGVIHCNHPDA